MDSSISFGLHRSTLGPNLVFFCIMTSTSVPEPAGNTAGKHSEEDGQGWPLACSQSLFEADLDADPTLAIPDSQNDDSLSMVIKVPETPPSDSEAHAITMYAKSKGVLPETISIKDVHESPEGLTHWASLHVDWSSRGAAYQSFRRAMKHDQFAMMVYPNLVPQLQLEFRQKWKLRNNFQFTSEKKVITMDHSKTEGDEGEYMTRTQLALDLGLAAFPNDCDERNDILKQRDAYWAKAVELGGRFAIDNTWLEATQVLRIKKLFKTSCTKTWTEVAERSSTVNLWEHHMAQGKAKRQYA